MHKRFTIVLPADLRRAVERKLKERKRGPKTASALIRNLLARWVGDSELAEVGRGRPRKDNGDGD